VSNATGPQNGKPTNRDVILGMGDGFYLLQRDQVGCGAHLALIKWVTGRRDVWA